MWVYTCNMSKCYCATLRAATRKINAIYDDVLTPVGINIGQYSMLSWINSLQQVSLTDLGRRMDLERSTVSRNIKVLESSGFVHLAKGEADRREIIATLTDRGRDVFERAIPLWKQGQKEVEDHLGPVRITALQEILKAF